MAIGGGFTLALLLPLARLAGWPWGPRWSALVQAHGHLQVLGWVGLFIIGMAFRLVPRFAGRPLRAASVVPAVFVLLVAGLAGRALAQPWAGIPAMHWLLMAAVLSELTAAILFAGSMILTLAPVLRRFPGAPLFLLGSVAFVLQAALGAIWLSRLSPALPVLTADRDNVLLAIQFYAFLLPFLLAVSLRSLPAFFKHRPARNLETWLLAVLLAAGCLLSSLTLPGGAEAGRLQGAGSLLLAAAMILGFAETGVWRPALGLRPSARHAAALIRTAYLWLLIAAGLLALAGVSGLVGGAPIPAPLADAIRHILAIGLFSTLIAGMAQLLLPVLAQRRLPASVAQRQTWALWVLFTIAAVLRMTGALLEGGGSIALSYSFIGVSGIAGISGVIVLAGILVRAVLAGPPEILLQEIRRG